MISNEKLIEYLSHPDDKQHYDRACSAFENKYRRTFEKVMGIKYSGKYSLYKKDIYDTFFTRFLIYITKDNGKKFQNIEDIDKLDGWIFKSALHFAESIRKDINEEFGIGIGETELDSNRRIGNEDDEDVNDIAEDDILNVMGDDSYSKAVLAKLISLISHKYYAEILTKNKIEGVSPELLAEEYNKEVSGMYMDISRAMVELYRVSLPKIQRSAVSMYKEFGDQLNKKDKEYLYKFLIERKPIEMISHECKTLEKPMSNALIKAYKELKKIYNKQKNEITYATGSIYDYEIHQR